MKRKEIDVKLMGARTAMWDYARIWPTQKAASPSTRAGLKPITLALLLVTAGLTDAVVAQSDVLSPPRAGQLLPTMAASYELQVYAPGADPARDNPFRKTVIPASAVHCDQPLRVAPAISINPASVRWRDPDNAARECVADVLSFLRTLPARAEPYLATLAAANAGWTSRRSAASNIFFRIAAPGEP